jgi:hypothetical protein
MSASVKLRDVVEAIDRADPAPAGRSIVGAVRWIGVSLVSVTAVLPTNNFDVSPPSGRDPRPARYLATLYAKASA